MKLVLKIAAFVAALGFMNSPDSKAMDLDRPSRQQIALARDLPATLVVRVDTRTNEVAVHHSKKKLRAMSLAPEAWQDDAFTPISSEGAGEQNLDRRRRRGGGIVRAAWDFAFSIFDFFRPRYYYYGYTYPYSYYYDYPSGYYRYYYYRYPYYWGW